LLVVPGGLTSVAIINNSGWTMFFV
jgi:hypothetical protein